MRFARIRESLSRLWIARARLPERWTLDTYPWALQPGVRRAQMVAALLDRFRHRCTTIEITGPLLRRAFDGG